MSKKTKAGLIIGASLFIIGCIIFVGVMSMLKWDFRKLSTVKYETNEYEITEEFNQILATTTTADVVLMPSEDGKCKIVCYEKTKVKHEVKVESGQLIIEAHDERRWYEHISLFSFEAPKITIYLPTDVLTSLNINASTGNIDIPSDFKFESIDISASTGNVSCYASATNEIKIELSTDNIRLKDISAGSVNLRVSTGSINLSSVRCDTLTSISKTGDVELKDVIASQKLHIEGSTGDVELERCDAQEIYIKVSTGDVEGSLLSEKIFITKTSTGDIEVPHSTTGGKCEITTSTGDIEIEIA